MYKVLIEKQAEKVIEKIPKPFYTVVKKAILDLSSNPRPSGYLKMKNREGYRIRIGDYRVVYEIKDKILTVFVIKVGHRKSIY